MYITVSKGIYWLASYPKSGNTWFRVFLQNLLENGSQPVLVNELEIGLIGSSRLWIDQTLGFDSADLYQSEINNLRPFVYEWVASQTVDCGYYKIHDACWQLDSGEWLISKSASLGALYFIRNPLDVAISYASHRHCSIDEVISMMSSAEHCMSRSEKSRLLANQTEQRLFSWSEHVTSWVSNPVIDTHVVRYEDMKKRPQHTFTKAVNFLKLPNDPCKISKALYFSDFKVLQQQEMQQTFREKPQKSELFFRKGVIGDWQQTLTKKQISQIINDHYEVMMKFGYVDDAGNPQVM